MSESYRIRGRVARRATKKIAIAHVTKGLKRKRIGRFEGRRKRIVVRADITRIDRYSAMKISANFLAPYSVLKPETSSDSPSAASKGAREVSATQDSTHIKKIVGRHIIRGTPLAMKVSKARVFVGSTTTIRIKAIEISYERVWASLRLIPIEQNLEFELHPMAKIV